MDGPSYESNSYHLGPPGVNGTSEIYSNGSVVNGNNDETSQLVPQLLHWSEVVYECVNMQIDDWNVAGGSDYGQLPYLIDSGDILLEIDEHRVTGFTRNDVLDIVHSKPQHLVKAVSSSTSFGLPIDLREYLSRRFVRGSVDHDLQATIRDNVYLRTIPCTTRPPRPGEMDSIDYKFVSREEFTLMERSGVLLESGIFSGHYYGTPLPLSNPTTPTVNHNGNEALSPSNTYSNVTEAMENMNIVNNNSPSRLTGQHSGGQQSSLAAKRKRNRSNIAAIDASSLPHGWEKISDAHYGVYYIDHINKRTQYERPYELELTKGTNGFGFTLIELDKGLVVVKNLIPGGPAYQSGIIQPGDVLVSVSGVSVSGLKHSDIARLFGTFSVGDRVKLTFARGYQLPPEINNDDSEYEFFAVSITKGSNGFGFTISDGTTGQKVKKILDTDRCGNLKQGDLLVSVNGINLAELPHTDVVEILKNCPIGSSANITIKRKLRFRSKTPMNLQSVAFGEKENQLPPPRNCKTPSCEMMMRRDLDWMVNDNQVVQVNDSAIPPGARYHENGNQDSNLFNDHLYSNGDYLPEGHEMIDSRVAGGHSNSAPQISTRQASMEDYNPNNSFAPISSHMAPPTQHSADMSPMDISPISDNVTSDDEYEYYRVLLTRNEAGFGFRLVGGSEEQRHIAIGSIVIGGVAHQDAILKSGDEIISINERNVVGASHHHVVELMGQCGMTVSLLVRRKLGSEAFEVMLEREETEGFGFVIISCGNCALIGRIIDGSPAQRCQQLRIRDRIIAVNRQDITKMSHPEIVNMIKESGTALCLKIIPSDCYTVELVRGPRGFGFSIRGGAEFKGMPLFILRIAPDGPAYTLLNVGDEMIEINGMSTVGMAHSDAVQIISKSGPQVQLKLRRNPGNGYDQGPGPALSPSMSYPASSDFSCPPQPAGPPGNSGPYGHHSPFVYSHSTPTMMSPHSPPSMHETHHMNAYGSP
ncbi:Membrane-associated guanylate kinase, WW and PDZ domain-containing protein 2 [Halotydeus destructor]|nr:Membrane-associated guanylate kinase, WW and PDZ domain-containing protein 2 [Halotydeus destructor]